MLSLLLSPALAHCAACHQQGTAPELTLAAARMGPPRDAVFLSGSAQAEGSSRAQR